MALTLTFTVCVRASAQTAYGVPPAGSMTADTLAPRPAISERGYLIGMGRTDLLDTYLMQEHSTGTSISYVDSRLHRRAGRRLIRETQHQIDLSAAGTRGNRKSMLTAMYALRLGWYCPWQLQARRLQLMAGALAGIRLGVTYNTRNSNNPAQARAALNISPAAKLRWHTRIGRRPLTLRYEASLPLVGIAFSPNYGQSYYEIFSQGNYDHNVVLTSPFSGPQLHQLLAADISLGRTSLTIGYMGDIRQMEANSLKYHQYTHSFVVGWRY